MIYLTLLSPVLAIPALLLMERLERWTTVGPATEPSLAWTRRENVTTPAPHAARRREHHVPNGWMRA